MVGAEMVAVRWMSCGRLQLGPTKEGETMRPLLKGRRLLLVGMAAAAAFVVAGFALGAIAGGRVV